MVDDQEDITQLKFHGKQDLAYMQSLSAAVVERSPRFLILVILLIFLFVSLALLWLSWAEIDVVIRGSGKVIPARQVQMVQSLEGGIVTEILVSEGDSVIANQPLLKISDIAFSSSVEENQVTSIELLARASRLTAEAFNQAYVSDEEVLKLAPEIDRSEKNLYQSHKQQLSDVMSILDEQVSQQQSALKDAYSKQNQLNKSLVLMQKEISLKKPLKERGIISEVDYLQLQQREADIEGELESVKISIPRLKSLIEETRFKKKKEALDFSNKAKQELNQINAEISRIKETQTALKDRVKRTTLRSPVNGIVQRLYANTVGGVLSPGKKVLEIVPLDDQLLIELKIKPADIASVDVGQEARLKFSAYDFAIHGSLKSIVIFVSADTITTEEGESFYLVRVKPFKSFLGHGNRPLPIKVGMTAEADIITNKKTILQYLLKPVTRGLNKALREQ